MNHNSMLDPATIRQQFPLFSHYPRLAYLDNAATTQKPKSVIDAITNFYEKGNANIHRGVYELAVRATHQYEGVRGKVAALINAPKPETIVYTAGTTAGINLVAQSFLEPNLQAGDVRRRDRQQYRLGDRAQEGEHQRQQHIGHQQRDVCRRAARFRRLGVGRNTRRKTCSEHRRLDFLAAMHAIHPPGSFDRQARQAAGAPPSMPRAPPAREAHDRIRPIG